MRRNVVWAPIAGLALAIVIALLGGGKFALAAPPAQDAAAISLPAPLYYIDQYSQQVTRLEMDGVTRRTITRETEPVTAFAVSPDGSKLAYVSGNRLIEADANGLNPVLKFAGPATATLDSLDLINDRVGAPVYSPDGARIAFAFNGVSVVASGPDAGPEAVNSVLPSDPFPAEGDFDGSQLIRFFRPHTWGPDGVHLVVDVSFYPEGVGLAILDPERQIRVDPAADSHVALAGDVAWKPDSTGFYIASDALAYGMPGLSLVDAGSGIVTGILTSPVSMDGSVSPLHLVRGPHVTGDGALWAFVSAQEMIDPAATYALEAIDPATGARTPVNEQAYPWPDAVLWARDDSGALLVTDGGATFQWTPVDGSAPVTLNAYGASPAWGSPDFGVTAPEAAEVLALFEQALDLDAVRASAEFPAFDPSVAFPVQAADGATYWIAHTTGTRSFNPDKPHAVGVYVRDGDGWREVSLLELTGTQDGVTAGPDYLSENSVSPVQIGTSGAATADGLTQLWLHVEGGAGAHSGVCEILRLAPVDALLVLTQELDSFNSSPGACEVQDVNGDGANEVVLNATDPYVFCYACGVRLINYSVQRWDGDEFVAVNLEPLPAAAPAELNSRNDELLRLIEGGLWKGALDLADSPVTAGSPVLAASAPLTATAAATDTVASSDTLTETVALTSTAETTGTTGTAGAVSDPSGVYAWNTALVRLTGEARRTAAQSPDHPYPLLAHLFYGDYPAAVDVMRAYSATAIFAQPSALVSGTVAAGWEGALADVLTSTASLAIDVNPQLAGAYFLRGYGAWLGGVTAATTGDIAPDAAPTTDVAIDPAALDAAVADIRRALELAPDPFYAESLALLTGEEVAVPATPLTATTTVTAPVEPVTTTAPVTTTVSPTVNITATGGAGRIFYSTVQDGVDRIYTLQFGSQNATLTAVLDNARQPSLQPGGVRLAYQSTRDDMLGLGGYDLDTGNRFNFTTNLEDSLPRWNPEGNRLAFSSTRYGDGRARVYLAWAQDAAFATDEALDLGEGSDPDWSPDGTRLVYKGCDETGANCGLWTMALDGTDRRALTDNASDARPRWSPGGSRVVFMSDGRDGNWDIYSVPVASDGSAGGEVTRISFNAASDGLPAVSPDGSEIVFVSNRGNQWGIWRVAVDSGRAVSVVGDLGALTNWLEQSLDWAP